MNQNHQTHHRLLVGLIAAATLWAGMNGVQYGLGAVPRHRAESAWFIFAGVCLLAMGWGMTRRDWVTPPLRPSQSAGIVAWTVGALGFAAVLYFPALSIGLLSDDFVLVQHAKQGEIVGSGWEFVRPLPLGVWAAVLAAAPSAMHAWLLHGINIVLHGINGALVGVIGSALGLSPGWASAAAMLFLANPLAPEAVAWTSGVFDLFLTCFVLSALYAALVWRTDERVRLATLLCLTVAALASKETAVALPVMLAAMVPVTTRADRRRGLATLSWTVGVVALYVVWRVLGPLPASHSSLPSGYALKEMLSRPFAALAVPIHTQATSTAARVALAASWPMAVGLATVRALRVPVAGIVPAAAVVWVLASVLPLSTTFFVSDTLQGSRYLYLAYSVWSIAIAWVLAWAPVRWHRLTGFVAGVLIVASAGLCRVHLGVWQQAAVLRDDVLGSYAAIANTCEPGPVLNVPDEVGGAYVFRNGLTEAVAPRSGQVSALPRCPISWSPSGFVRTDDAPTATIP